MALQDKVKSYTEAFGTKASMGAAATLAALLSVATPQAGLAQDFHAQATHSTPQTLQAPSKLVPDADGVLWFKKGADSETQYSLGRDLSGAKDNLVIIASGAKDTAKKMAEFAKKLKAWLEKNPGVGQVDIVASNRARQGGGFHFYIDGTAYSPLNSSKTVFYPKDLNKHLPLIARVTQLQRAQLQTKAEAENIPTYAAR